MDLFIRPQVKRCPPKVIFLPLDLFELSASVLTLVEKSAGGDTEPWLSFFWIRFFAKVTTKACRRSSSCQGADQVRDSDDLFSSLPPRIRCKSVQGAGPLCLLQPGDRSVARRYDQRFGES